MKHQFKVDSQVEKDPMYQFMYQLNSSVNLSIKAFNKGVKKASELMIDFEKLSKEIAKYIKNFTTEQKDKFFAIKALVDEVNPIQLKGEVVKNFDATKVKNLELSALDHCKEKNIAKGISV